MSSSPAKPLLRVCFLVAALLGLASCQPTAEVEPLVIQNVERTIDVSSQLVQVVQKLRLENQGTAGGKYFLFTVEPLLKNHLSFIGASLSSGKDSKNKLRTSLVSLASPNNQVLTYKIELPSSSPLTKGKALDVEVETVYSRYLVPFPEEVTQKDKQLVKFVGSHYLYSPYKVVKQTTKVILSSKNVESFTKLKPSSQSENTLSFGPYENIAPLTVSELTAHYENNSPFLTVTNMVRTIEVSHWGNIAVEEHIDILHTGAKLKGSFSRFDYQREPNSGINSIKNFKTILPAAARDVYYRDDIGNISTSNMYVRHDSVELTLRPRFPLFGGWKTRYVIGYNLPSYEYLFTEGSAYVLKMRLLDHIFDSLVVDDLTVKIILPEGGSDIKLKAPYNVKELPRSLHFTYLDITGRPVITLEKKNLVENHIQDFEIAYNFPRLYMLREPLIVIAAFLVLFVTVLIYVRLDFSISPASKQASAKSSGSGSQAVVESVLRRHGKRAGLYETFEAQINKLKSTKDVANYQSAFKNLTADHKAETQAINDIIVKTRAESPELADSITELQRLDRGIWEVHVTFSTAVEKLVAGKMPRQQFMEQDNQFNRKRDELFEKSNQIVKNL